MSLVGPRPPIPYELENYEIWHRRRVIDMKPGITGMWQVVGRSRTTFNEMVRLDIYYLANWSIWLDLKLLILTPWVVFTSKGAY
jgi:lipopolysaccharide/colanic/teichoic acid biosynthesis glycosyltransferase